MSSPKTIAPAWPDYQLLDAGGGKKLERWGKIITIRPDIQAYFHSGKPFSEWRALAHWEFVETPGKNGRWKALKTDAPTEWQITFGRLKFILGTSTFKHVGLFPEQSVNWTHIDANLKPENKFLNLFAYTGAASCMARLKGADTFHIDSSKSVLNWASQNMDASRLLNIHWVLEDALKFAEREARRGHFYDYIIMDPPAWGNGPKGEKWKLEDKIDQLFAACAQILNPTGLLTLNTYSPSIEPSLLAELAEMYFEGRPHEQSGLYLESQTEKSLYCGELLRIGQNELQ
ncbi:MAG: class I SAM-dependent methyltransferase [Sphingomonadales bacterium]